MSFRSDQAKANKGAHEFAERMRDAHRQIDRFFDWAGYSDCRKMHEWREWATAKLRSGWTVEQAVDRVKEAWYEHRRFMRLPMRNEPPTPEQMVQNMRAISAVLGEIVGAHPMPPAVSSHEAPNEDWFRQHGWKNA